MRLVYRLQLLSAAGEACGGEAGDCAATDGVGMACRSFQPDCVRHV